MASESSSAVLDLNDADPTEDTEAPSVSDDANEGIPLIMEHGHDIAVKVDAPMKQLSTLETYVSYRVRCVCARWPVPPAVRRRYNHFRALHKRLAAAHPLLAVPPLPPLHSARQQLDRYSPSFVAVRTLALDAFLSRVARHPILTHSEHLRVFVTATDEELAQAFRGDGALALWGLPRAAERPTNGARVKDPEFSSAADYLSSLQQKLTALCALTVKLDAGAAALAQEHMGMKRACDAWASQAGGGVARAAGAAAAGAGAAAAGAGAGAEGAGAGLRARATLPLLAAYSQAHLDKIRQRDAMHAAYVSGNNTGDLHNRLEQASEALRCELAAWIPSTRDSVRSLLLELAERRLAAHARALRGWERALHAPTETNVEELFKTVSLTAVQNLSPAKCAPALTDTERDADDLDSSDELSKVDSEFEVVKEKAAEDPLHALSDVDLTS